MRERQNPPDRPTNHHIVNDTVIMAAAYRMNNVTRVLFMAWCFSSQGKYRYQHTEGRQAVLCKKYGDK
jgi:hypothetical protein